MIIRNKIIKHNTVAQHVIARSGATKQSQLQLPIKSFFLVFFILLSAHSFALNSYFIFPLSSLQKDSSINPKRDTSLPQKKDTSSIIKRTGPPLISFKKDTTPVQFHNPHISTLRSAILPGWGQAYNRDYWKIPVVYGVLAIPAVTWVYNNTWYKRTRDAYNIVVNNDTLNFSKIDYRLQPLINDPATIQYYRNYFRKSRDYSVLYFLLAWGLNVADATVFGHLKGFDVSDDLSLNMQPIIAPGTNNTTLGIHFSLQNTTHKTLPVW